MEQLAGEGLEGPEHTFARAGGYKDFGMSLRDHGRFPEAELFLRRALDTFRDLAHDHPDRGEFRQAHAFCLSMYAILRWQSSLSPEADELLATAVGQLEQVVAEHPGQSRARLELAVTWANRASLQLLLGQSGRAADAIRKAERQFNSAELAEVRDTTEFRRGTALVHYCWAGVRSAAEEWPAAEAEAERAVAILTRLKTDFPDVLMYRREWADFAFTQAGALVKTGRAEQAEKLLGEVAAALQADDESSPGRADLFLQRDRADVQYHLAVARAGRNPAAAEPAFRTAAERFEKLAGEFPDAQMLPRDRARTATRFGEFLRVRGRSAEAVDALQQGIDLRRRVTGPTPADRRLLAGALYNLALIYQQTARPAEAETAYREALAIQDAVVAEVPDSEDYRRLLVWVCNNLGGLLNDQDRDAAAREVFQKILDREGVLRNCTDPNCLVAVGQAHLLTDDPAGAIGPFEAARKRAAGTVPAVFFLLAVAHAQAGDPDAARRALDEGKAWLAANGSRDPRLTEMREESEREIGKHFGPPGPRRR
jgi:tetratricopeptide (TPR) repeat protein